MVRPGGRVAPRSGMSLQRNPWMTIPRQALIEAGHLEAPDPSLPGPFTLAEPPGRLHALLDEAGFTEVVLDVVDRRAAIPRCQRSYMASTVEISSVVPPPSGGLASATQQRAAIVASRRVPS